MTSSYIPESNEGEGSQAAAQFPLRKHTSGSTAHGSGPCNCFHRPAGLLGCVDFGMLLKLSQASGTLHIDSASVLLIRAFFLSLYVIIFLLMLHLLDKVYSFVFQD